MKSTLSVCLGLGLNLIFTVTPCSSEEINTISAESSKYLDAVREFADNVLKYGRDTYGPKHTPLFVDGLDIHTHEPVRWIDPNGTKWILSNLASQQNLLRTLDGLTRVTGDSKYKQAAMDAIEYAFENLQIPNGLLHWGGHQAYDAQGDRPRGRAIHELKCHYPYYDLMWEVDHHATEQFIEAFWSAHIVDWSNLDMNRHASIDEELEEPWEHEYKDGPAFIQAEGYSFANTGSDLIYAAASLAKLSKQKQPLIWARRLARRYIDVRHPNTGISYNQYTLHKQVVDDSYDDILRKLVSSPNDLPTTAFPSSVQINPIARQCLVGYLMSTPGITAHSSLFVWQSQLLSGGMLGAEGNQLKQWALEEFTAFGKASYRSQDNVYVPILTDGTSIDGYFVKKDGPLGPKGATIEPLHAGPSDFWAYSMAWRITKDEFMWEMARSIARGNGFGDIGLTSEVQPDLNVQTHCSDPYSLLAFLELNREAGHSAFLEIMKKIGDNILADRFCKGFFVASNRHSYTKFDAIDSLALLHLHSQLVGEVSRIPQVYPSRSLFETYFRKKDIVPDNQIFYTLTNSGDPPMSLQEAAAIGDISLVRSILDKGTAVDSREDGFYRTALQRATSGGHKEIVELLLDTGADINVKSGWPGGTPLHLSIQNGHKEIARMLISRGADVNAKIEGSPKGDTPLHSAARAGHKDVVELLLAKGADVTAKNDRGRSPIDVVRRRDRSGTRELLLATAAETTIHAAAQAGDLEKIQNSVQAGIDVNEKDESGMTPLLHAVAGGHTELAEFLLDSGADVNTGDKQGVVPLFRALWNTDLEMLELLLKKGADVNTKHARSGFTVLHWAAMMDSKESVELILDAGADVNAKSNTGETSLDVAAIWGVSTAMAELLVAKGAEVLSLHAAAHLGDLPKVRAFISEGVEVNQKSGLIEGTALHSAAAAGHKEMVEFLISKGSDVNAQNGPGRTPLHMAAQKGHWDVVQLLLKNGADVNVKDRRRRGRTPLDLARENGHTQIVEILTKKSSSLQGLVKEPQKIEQSEVAREATQLLFAAVKTSDIEQVKEQLASGADVNARDATGRMPVHYAVANSRKDIVDLVTTPAIRPGGFEDKELTKVKKLLSQDMDVNAQPAASKTTLLHYAAQTGYVYVAAYLIVHGANVDAENKSGDTPLDIALQWKEPTIALLLLDAGATATKRDRSNNILLKAAGQIGPYGEKRAGYENHNQIVESSGGTGSKHDIAISKTSAVKTCIQGDIVPVTATLDNRGHQEESARVILFNDKAVVAVHQIKLGVSAQNEPEDTPDIFFDPENVTRNIFGQRVCIGGDVNGDGFGDVLIGAWGWQNNRGRAYLYFGGPHMDHVADVVFTGIKEGDGFANQSGVFGDVNNDGYDDVIIGAIGNANADGGIQDGYVHVYLGGPHMDNVPDIILSPAEAGRRGGFGFVASGDVDNDGYCDILVGEPWSRRVSLFWGGDPLSTSTESVFECTENAWPFSHRMVIGGDVNGDGYNDILIGARERCVWLPESKEGDSNTPGRAYLYFGNSKQQMDTDCDWRFVGETPGSSFGSAVDIFDIDNDGYDDVIIAARYASSLRGRVYVYWGRESFDGSEPGVIFEPKEVSGAGEYLQVGHINSDLFGDILVGGWIYPGQKYRHGRAYVFYGNSKDAIDTDCDHIFEGEGRTEDWFGAQLGVGDVNNDGYTDAIVGAWGANHWAGRAYLFYGPFSATTNVTFNWDTTNASMGKHTLKVEIPPVPGEQNTEDNIKTVTIEVKEPHR